MIIENITLSAPLDRSFETLNYIARSATIQDRVNVGKTEDGKKILISIKLCIQTLHIPVERALSAAALNSSFCEMVQRIKDPIIEEYILEDGLTILHLQNGEDEQTAMLLQDSHAAYRNIEWDEPLYIYRKNQEHDRSR